MPVPAWVRKFQAAYSRNMLRRACCPALFSPAQATAIETDGGRVSYWMLLKNFVPRWCRSC